MKERPILISAPMVRASLGGTKTKTRRAVKGSPARVAWNPIVINGYGGWCDEHGRPVPCPYGEAGDRLWVRETFFAFGRWETRFSEKKKRDEWHFVDMTNECGEDYLYAADGVSDTQAFIKRRSDAEPMYWKRPAIFMPRRASRITLEITGVRVERLQDISEKDAHAEGVTIHEKHTIGYCAGEYLPPAIRAYRELWDQINGAGSWDANPWVWCVSFRRI